MGLRPIRCICNLPKKNVLNYHEMGYFLLFVCRNGFALVNCDIILEPFYFKFLIYFLGFCIRLT